MAIKFVHACTLGLLLAGCGYEKPATGDLTPAAEAKPATTPSPQPRGNAWVEPANVSPCEVAKGVVGEVNWDYSTKAAVTKVRVMVPGQGGAETLFSEGSAAGSATTGGWLQPGTKFLFRNAGDDSLLDTVVIGEAPCA